jgi:hypothetical protein
VAGLAVSDSVGFGAAVTATAAVAEPLPPAPVQLSVKFAAAVSAALAAVPPVACVPLQAPDAVHAVALVELQVSVVVVP